jgi:hypothetical protein
VNLLFLHYHGYVLTCFLSRESGGEWTPEPLLGPKMLALFDYLHVRALFTTKDAMHKALKSVADLNDALQKRMQVHAASRAELEEGLKEAFLGAGGQAAAGGSKTWNDEASDGGEPCLIFCPMPWCSLQSMCAD